MTSSKIRQKFLEFFEKREHKIVSSDLLVPRDDPTLLFTGAGMNQFKNQFMGRNITFKRAASCQKCLRTGDLENVGRTPRHHTFFEMLGNFSFGDYFKEDAIRWAWEFMTKEMGIPRDKLWVSVYTDDAESYGIWRDLVKVPEKRIVKLGPKDNFWPANAPAEGPNGPCGPCSEIFYDLGKAPGAACVNPGCDPSCDCGRFLEVWNLVFTEFEREQDGALVPLPNKNIDTGMGMERIAAVMQNVTTNFDTDLFTSIKEHILKELGGGKDIPLEDLNLIADHVRAVVFSIADGISPSNEKQGYVVRKLLRRAYLKSNLDKPFLYNLVPVVTRVMKDVYPDAEEKREHISAIVKEEEVKFGITLNSAMPVLEEMLSTKSDILSGENIFKLVDTYGLPYEVIEQETVFRGKKTDREGFNNLMAGRKELSRKGSNIENGCIFSPDLFNDAPKPASDDSMPLNAELVFMVKGSGPSNEISEGEMAEVIISPQSSKVYAESGGQAGDTGTIEKSGATMDVVNSCDAGGRKVLEVLVKQGSFRKGDSVTFTLDAGKKQLTAMNHTATHLLQAALREVLGGHVKQSGSLVDARHLRFDCTHMKKLTDRELIKVESLVNGWIEEGVPVSKEIKTLKEATDDGALSFFGEKYGDTVRVVSAGGVSKELCGGTHVDNTKEIGVFKIISESSIASGIRRIEALTGDKARTWVKDKARAINDEAHTYKNIADTETDIKTAAAALINATNAIMNEVHIDPMHIHDFASKIKPDSVKLKERAEKIKKKAQKNAESSVLGEIAASLEDASGKVASKDGVRYASGIFHDIDASLLRKAVAQAGKKIKPSVIVVGSDAGGKATLLCAVSPDIAGEKFSAKDIVNAVVDEISGGGGGNDVFAQAGGTNAAGLAKAVKKAGEIVSGG